ncbi:HAMP domain-containing sensor histidine kinase [Flammeovirga sp. SubArs3]|uniref:HAMP domain-containing sensor histidine kinase n=1 Tax=Flammeovirga sp. SubArs3 TaxID=2995316 RepID=UPI00248B184A|nr:HAMP domain-containing sensor histidine kinase [Flammeovirga sp. SubArs3]
MNNGSLRGRILTAFISFSILFSCISFITYKYIHRSEELDQVKAWLMSMEVSVLDLIKEDATELSAENHPFSSLSSDRLEDLLIKRENKVELITVSIDKLISHEQIHEWKLENDIVFIDSLIKKYNITVQQLIKAKKQLGSETSGLYGELYKSIKTLSGLKEERYVKLFNEMQLNGMKYLLNPKTSYVLRINKSSEQLLDLLQKNNGYKKESAAAEKYLAIFNDIVLLQYKIGKNNQEGLKGKLHNTAAYIESEFDSLSTDVSNRFVTLMWKIKLSYLLISLVAVLFTVLVGYYTASRVSFPITVLEDRTRRVIESGYMQSGTPIDFKSLKRPTKEVAALANSFQEMYDMIQNQFEELEQGNEKLMSSKKKLMESNKVKDQFFSIISHDLKGPINTQIGFLKILMERSNAFTADEITMLAKDMHASMKNIMGLMDNLLSWSRSASNSIKIDRKKNRLNTLVEKNVNLLSGIAKEKNITLSYHLEEDYYCYIDNNSMDCVIRNLMSNAMKFTKNDGNGQIRISTKRIGDKVELLIEDNGVGMTEGELKKLLNPSVQYSTKGTKSEKGVGLGMILVQDFIKRNNGLLKVESEKGYGTKCFILFDLLLENNQKQKEQLP